MGFPILVRCHLYIELGPWFLQSWCCKQMSIQAGTSAILDARHSFALITAKTTLKLLRDKFNFFLDVVDGWPVFNLFLKTFCPQIHRMQVTGTWESIFHFNRSFTLNLRQNKQSQNPFSGRDKCNTLMFTALPNVPAPESILNPTTWGYIQGFLTTLSLWLGSREELELGWMRGVCTSIMMFSILTQVMTNLYWWYTETYPGRDKCNTTV